MKTVASLLVKTVSKYGQRPFLGVAGKWVTYEQFMERVDWYQTYLTNIGAVKNKLVIQSTNSVDSAAMMFAGIAVQNTIIPLSPKQTNTDQIINKLKPKYIYQYGQVIQNTETSNDDTRDIAFILYTSGSTGEPKGAMLTHENILSNIASTKRQIGERFISENDRYVSFLPWSHTYGLSCELLYGVSCGASFGLNQNLSSLTADMRLYRPTVLCTVPKMLHAVHQRIPDLVKRNVKNSFVRKALASYLFGGRLKHMSVGGASCPMYLLDFYEDMGINIYQGYGSTELSPLVSLNSANENKKGSVGKILDCNSVIFDDNRQIIVAGDNVFKGYYGEPLPSNDKIVMCSLTGVPTTKLPGMNRFETGDTGYLDNDGYLFIDGRMKDTYKLTNGRFVNPVVAEEVFGKSKVIQQCMLYGSNQDSNTLLVYAPGFSEIGISEEIQQLGKEIQPKYTIPEKFVVMKEPFTVENGQLTAKGTLRRSAIVKRYHDELNKSIKISRL